MSDDEQSSRTEEATPKRLQQARERGEIAQSQEVQVWATLCGGALALAILAPPATERALRVGVRFLERPEQVRIAFSSIREGVGEILLEMAIILGPTLLLLALFGTACGLAQAGPMWAPQRLAPDFSKLSPLKGIQRLVSPRALIDLVKSLLKLAVVSAVLVVVLRPYVPGLEHWASLSTAAVLARSDALLVRIAAAVAAVTTLVAAADYMYQRFSFLARMRMTKQELRDEFKEADGDPNIKGRIRRLRQERARKRMMAAVPTATVVITNPTHFAVALAYDMAAMPAPKVVAKGVDQLALRIREVAAANNVPVVENPPLARSLHASVEIDDEIPAEHYQAVAQVIGWVMKTKGERTSR
ncbi:MAG: flagellar biosynthesis protein FlhB [Rhodospirillales bacterium]|nr:flagellar biosynthesis protein FlhB [Rhodospirillales bacterium]